MWTLLKAWCWYFWQRFQAGPPLFPTPTHLQPMSCHEAEGLMDKVARRLLSAAEVEASRARQQHPILVRFMDADMTKTCGECTFKAHERRVNMTFEGRVYQASHQDGETWVYRQATK